MDACWYTAANTGMSCNEVCAVHGGFDAAGSQHVGTQVADHFYPDAIYAGDWMDVECTVDNLATTWASLGGLPSGDLSHPSCYFHCACNS